MRFRDHFFKPHFLLDNLVTLQQKREDHCLKSLLENLVTLSGKYALCTRPLIPASHTFIFNHDTRICNQPVEPLMM